jgi:hypothetical protein
MPDDPKSGNPVKLSKPYRVNDECLADIKAETIRAINIFADHQDFQINPWDYQGEYGAPTGIVLRDMAILRKMYKLKKIYENSNG